MNLSEKLLLWCCAVSGHIIFWYGLRIDGSKFISVDLFFFTVSAIGIYIIYPILLYLDYHDQISKELKKRKRR